MKSTISVLTAAMVFASAWNHPAFGANNLQPKEVKLNSQVRNVMGKALSDCVKAASAGQSSIQISMPNGEKLELAKDAKGAPEYLQMQDVHGATMRIEGFLGPDIARRKEIAARVATDPDYLRAKAQARRALLKSLQLTCKSLMDSKEEIKSGSVEKFFSVNIPRTTKSSGHGPGVRGSILSEQSKAIDEGGCDTAVDEGGDCGGSGDGEGGESGGQGGDGTGGGSGDSGGGDTGAGSSGGADWTADDFMIFATENIERDFADAMASYLFDAKKAPIVNCSVVIQDCKEMCTAVGTLETTGCVALGAAAGASLTPPIGFATGFYCTGRVVLATQSCVASCRVPQVICNP